MEGRTHVRHMAASERGFSLVEVAIVVTVIAVLIAIAIPVFLGAKQRSEDRAAQSNLRTAFTAAKALSVEEDTGYALATVDALQRAEPSLQFRSPPPPSTGPLVISVHPVNESEWVATARSDTGTCFAIRASNGGGTRYGKSDTGPCRASEVWAASASDSSW